MKNPQPQVPNIDAHGATKSSQRTEVNADQYLIARLNRSMQVECSSKSSLDDRRLFGDDQAHLMLVAGGVGSSTAAKRASSLAVDTILEQVLNTLPWSRELDVDAEAELRTQLRESVVRCNDRVAAADIPAAETAEVSTALTLAFVRWPNAFIVHAGDSRAYRVRGDEIARLTDDHNFAATESGDAPEGAATGRRRFASLLWNAVGGDGEVTPELTVVSLEPGDSLLLCTDGLSRHLSDGAIGHIVTDSSSAATACETLLDVAESAGGHDDVTLAIANFGQDICAAVETATPEAGDAVVRKHVQLPPSRPTPHPHAPPRDSRLRRTALA